MGCFRIFISISLLVGFSSCFTPAKLDKAMEKKPVLATYSGGGKFYTRLVLFKDSSYLYGSFPDFFPSVAKKHTGRFSMDNNYITLRSSNGANTFRVKGDSILMYTENDEQSKDAKFIMDYYTLTKDRR